MGIVIVGEVVIADDPGRGNAANVPRGRLGEAVDSRAGRRQGKETGGRVPHRRQADRGSPGTTHGAADLWAGKRRGGVDPINHKEFGLSGVAFKGGIIKAGEIAKVGMRVIQDNGFGG
ncbi:MAG: hypothetical protein ACRCYW_15560, partial [Aeromonas sp.]|uniref:hypothetical protein n=1 Tax=Aeromonas sp. TaxID=647 RepID=UPI003F2A22E4